MSVAVPKIIVYDGLQGRISTQQEAEPTVEEDAPFQESLRSERGRGCVWMDACAHM